MHEIKVGFIRLFETQVQSHNISFVATGLFTGQQWLTNVAYVPKVRIWVTWKPYAYQIGIVDADNTLFIVEPLNCILKSFSLSHMFMD